MMTDRVKKLREDSLNAVPRISLERALIVTETYKQNAGSVATPVLRALCFKNLMEQKKICILDGELIVGERGEAPAVVPTYPELCCHTLEDFEIMDKRERISFKVAPELMAVQRDTIIPYWQNRAQRGKILHEMTQEWRDCYAAGLYTEFMEQRGPGHTVAGDKIYRKGFLDIQNDILDSLGKLDFFTDPQALDKKAELEAMLICTQALITFAKRHAALARELAAAEGRPQRRAELLEIAETCERVPAHPPRSFREALQMYWFVHVGCITEMNNWDSFCPGRLDQHLIPFYRREVAAGTLTRDAAEELLQCFWVKFNNQPAPPKVGVTLKESGTYTDFCNINIGGMTPDGEDGVNELSFLLLDVVGEMKLLQPSTNIQVCRKNPDEFIRHAARVIREGRGQPSCFNADAVVQELLRMGKSLVDARCGGNSGCVETGAFGHESYILTGYFNIPKVLEITLNNGVDPQTGKQLGPQTGDPAAFASFDQLYAAFETQMRHFIDIKMRGNNVIERLYATEMPVPFLSTVIDDCVAKGMDYNAGGARYNTMYIQGVGVGTITDSLAALKKHVFEEKSFTMRELLDALAKNFDGGETIHHLVNNRTPKYGNDDDYADTLMRRVFDSYLGLIDGRPSMKGGTYRINMLPTTCHVYFGSVIGATPDGRLAKQPLPEGISPSKGADRKGPTAVIKSAAKMDHLKTGGTLLNQKFTPQILADERGIENLKDLIRGYFALNGHHIQFNVVTRDTLRAAQANPAEYKDLIVRVAGYSDYFHNLDKTLQDEIIGRTEQEFACGCG